MTEMFKLGACQKIKTSRRGRLRTAGIHTVFPMVRSTPFDADGIVLHSPSAGRKREPRRKLSHVISGEIIPRKAMEWKGKRLWNHSHCLSCVGKPAHRMPPGCHECARAPDTDTRERATNWVHTKSGSIRCGTKTCTIWGSRETEKMGGKRSLFGLKNLKPNRSARGCYGREWRASYGDNKRVVRAFGMKWLATNLHNLDLVFRGNPEKSESGVTRICYLFLYIFIQKVNNK